MSRGGVSEYPYALTNVYGASLFAPAFTPRPRHFCSFQGPAFYPRTFVPAETSLTSDVSVINFQIGHEIGAHR